MRMHKLLAAFCVASAATAQAADFGDLTIEASGFAHDGGHAVAKLFAPGDDVLGPGHWQTSAAIESGRATLLFANVTSGQYAVVVFHDVNDNGVLDHGMFGPAEPLGFSAGFSLGLLSGLPSFEKLKFDFRPPAQSIAVRVK